MYALGHLGIAIACYTPILVRRRFDRRAVAGLLCVAALSTLPDVDSYVASIPHRGVTHTVWFAIFVGLALGFAFAFAAPDRGRRLAYGGDGALAGTVAVLSHLLGDLLTPMGILPLAPIAGGQRLTLALVYARNPTANQALFFFGVAVLAGATLGNADRRGRIRAAVGRNAPSAVRDPRDV